MAQFEVRLPKMGESVTEATITGWLKISNDGTVYELELLGIEPISDDKKNLIASIIEEE